MPAPNLFLIYVTDIERSTTFYSDLFDIDPNFTSPRYVAFEVAPGVLFAIWNGHEENISPDTPRTSEIGLMVPGSASAVDAVYQTWVTKGVRVASRGESGQPLRFSSAGQDQTLPGYLTLGRTPTK